MNTIFFSTAYAADTAGGAFSVATLMQYGPLILIFVVFYFLLIRPQQVRQRQLREKQNSLRRGDKIVTAGGIVGVVQATREDSPEVEVEIASNVRVKIVRTTITTVIPRDKPANDA
ncbi:preprotein translocase subunit YajC [Aristophania vespae]|uniref:Sec translocon accessory complex subunit YajC n=1 Tax=Aristophania vespae TaxID=2697033 RepID=A0A6P1NEP3_9PROT|nr:preprotein translocase subunit YajC [Aristophania vespae]QHI95327.1 preprotein translocase subunit YajC [Aristophania vespae]UMM64587.1 Sec translocon accessory complex subunit YajC [Aristophania vespae]